MPLIPAFKFTGSWRESTDGRHLLALTITDDEDGRSTTIYRPSDAVWDALVLAMIDALQTYADDHLL